MFLNTWVSKCDLYSNSLSYVIYYYSIYCYFKKSIRFFFFTLIRRMLFRLMCGSYTLGAVMAESFRPRSTVQTSQGTRRLVKYRFCFSVSDVRLPFRLHRDRLEVGRNRNLRCLPHPSSPYLPPI